MKHPPSPDCIGAAATNLFKALPVQTAAFPPALSVDWEKPERPVVDPEPIL
jgi:hypothetical protein